MHVELKEQRKHNIKEEIVSSLYDQAFTRLTNKLDIGFQIGKVYTLTEILHKYHELLRELGHINAEGYISAKLKKRLICHYGDGLDFRSQRNPNQPLLVLSTKSNKLMTNLGPMTKQSESQSENSFSVESNEQVFYKSLYYVVNRIKQDLKTVSSVTEVSDEAASNSVPDSLYLLLKWLYSDGQNEDNGVDKFGWRIRLL